MFSSNKKKIIILEKLAFFKRKGKFLDLNTNKTRRSNTFFDPQNNGCPYKGQLSGPEDKGTSFNTNLGCCNLRNRPIIVLDTNPLAELLYLGDSEFLHHLPYL